jgi:hypothetical protein
MVLPFVATVVYFMPSVPLIKWGRDKWVASMGPWLVMAAFLLYVAMASLMARDLRVKREYEPGAEKLGLLLLPLAILIGLHLGWWIGEGNWGETIFRPWK